MLDDLKSFIVGLGISLETPALLVMKPTDADFLENNESWDGKMAAIKKSVTKSQEELTELFKS